MSYFGNRTMSPRNGRKFVVLIVARISGCASQKDVSLDDQQEHAQQYAVESCGEGEIEYRIVATKGKGEELTRPELAEVETAIRSNDLDLLIVEDLGRLIRGAEATRLCGIAVDHNTRVIAIHDCIDTWYDDWESDVIAACRDHVGHNAHTSKRIKKKLMLRFMRQGAATPCPIAGYVKPEDARTFLDWSVDDEARPFILKGAEILRKTGNYSAVADYFESVQFPVGSHCRTKKWNGAMVRRFYANPLLKGKPERGNKHTVKHNETGKRRSVKNPNGPVAIDVPHLEVIPELEFDAINALLNKRNAVRGRKPYSNGQDPLAGVPRKRTGFPGQHARCWYCPRVLVQPELEDSED